MKPFLILALAAAFAASASAQTEADVLRSSSQLKEKFKGQRAPGGAAETAPLPGPGGPPDGGQSIADLEALLLKSPECRKNPDDSKDLAKNLKGKYGIIACDSPIDGLQQIILVPKSTDNPSQQLRYATSYSQGRTYKLLRARFFDHFLVLEFDKQIQYLDLLKYADGGFALAGFVADGNARSEDDGVFADALRRYMGIAPSSADAKAADKIGGVAKAEVGDRPHRLSGSVVQGRLLVTVTTGGETWMIWPDVRRPKP